MEPFAPWDLQWNPCSSLTLLLQVAVLCLHQGRHQLQQRNHVRQADFGFDPSREEVGGRGREDEWRRHPCIEGPGSRSLEGAAPLARATSFQTHCTFREVTGRSGCFRGLGFPIDFGLERESAGARASRGALQGPLEAASPPPLHLDLKLILAAWALHRLKPSPRSLFSKERSTTEAVEWKCPAARGLFWRGGGGSQRTAKSLTGIVPRPHFFREPCGVPECTSLRLCF